MNKKVLFVAKVAHGHILTFHKPYLKMLKEMGYEVHVATGDEAEIPYCDTKYTVPIKGSPVSISNYIAYRELKRIIENEHYDLVHTHTSMGGAIGRLAARKSRKNGTAIMHTAHGFSFYKGAPLLSWLIYYPIEKLCSSFTDCLITMNKEDYNVAKVKLYPSTNYFVNGVGVNINEIKQIETDRSYKRKELGLSSNTIVIVSVGELIKRKNHEAGIRAIELLVKGGITNIHYLICGRGVLYEYLMNLIDKLELNKYITLVGFRKDVKEIMACSDIFLFPSLAEGLPVALIEAMALGLPVVASDIRGNNDLINDNGGGFLVKQNNIEAYASYIKEFAESKDLRFKMGESNRYSVDNYDIDLIKNEMEVIYKRYLL